MARPSKTAEIDYTIAHDLSHGLLERASCLPDATFVLVRDADKKGLRLRVTKAGGKHWQFETRIKGKLFTRALGEWPAVSIDDAKAEGHRLRGLTEKGIDPRDSERQHEADKAAHVAAAAAHALTVGEIWPRYLAEGAPKRRDAWKPRYRADLEAMAGPGGEKKKRGKGVTRPGPMFPLMAMRLIDVDEDTLKTWFDREAVAGKHQATRALMMFRGFLRWCSSKPEFRAMTNRDAGRAAAILDQLPSTSANKRTDSVSIAQVPGWWAGVERLGNRTASVYLKALLLTGARKEELAALTWANVDFRWHKLTIADKVDKSRVIPLTPYLAQQLATLPRVVGDDDVVNPHVFSSRAKAGRITDARSSLSKVMLDAGIEKLTIHGLRRTFVQLGRGIVPAGAVAQIAGHKPSATAEGYAVLPLDDLRPYAEQIEAHILAKAGIKFDAKAEPGKLRVVTTA